MKKIFFLILFFQGIQVVAQPFELKIIAKDLKEPSILEKLLLKQSFTSEQELKTEIIRISNQLNKLGFLNHQLTLKEQTSNLFLYNLQLNSQVTETVISFENITDAYKKILKISSSLRTIPFETTENYLENLTVLLEQSGYGTSSVQLVDFVLKNNVLYAKLQLNIIEKQTITSLKIIGYDKFPKTISSNIFKRYQSKILTSAEIEKIYNDFNLFSFIKQVKKPELLIKPDSTQVFVYLEPKNSNTFDGFVGFITNELGKIALTGNLHLQLQNIFNSGEKIKLHWQNNGEKRSEFNLNTTIPYLFKTKFAIETTINILKNDSLFQNTNLDLGIHYLWKPNLTIGSNFTEIQSTNLQKSASLYQNFTKKYFSTLFNYQIFDYSNAIFPKKLSIRLQSGIGNRTTSNEKQKQYFIDFKALYHFKITEKQKLYLKNTSYYLKSNEFIINELPQLGGIETIRGFTENSIIANQYFTFLSEYRYFLSTNIYVHTITDYGIFKNEFQKTNGTLVSFGAGLGMQTNGGFFQLLYANGKATTSTTNFTNGIVHLKYSVNF